MIMHLLTLNRVMLLVRSISSLHVLLIAMLLFLGMNTAGADPQKTTIKTWTNQQLLTEMHVVSAAEGDLGGHPALVIHFSQPLDSKRLYNDFISVTQNNNTVKGSWILATETRQLYFTSIDPDKKYTIEVNSGITASNGLTLNESSVHQVKTQSLKAAAKFATNGSVLPPRLTRGIPIRVINVDEIDVEFLRVKPDKLKALQKTIDLNYGLNRWNLQEAQKISSSVYASRFMTGAKKNTRTTTLIPVEDIAELQQPGLYFAVVRQAGDFSDNSYDIMYFTVSDIGLHIRKYSRQIEVFTSSLLTGKPLTNVDLSLQGEKENLTAKTDDQGRASFDHIPKGRLLLSAQTGQQLTFIDMRLPALDLSDFSVAGALDKPVRPFVYSTRDLFRPGEEVDLSILLRDRDGKMVKADQLYVAIKSSSNKTIFSRYINADELGYFGWKLNLPLEAETGRWHAAIKRHEKDKEVLTEWPFNVEAFMPERMKLALDSEQDYVKKGLPLNISVQGDYLYGAPAAGNKLDGRYSFKAQRHPLADLEDFYFGHPSDKNYESNQIDAIKLDDKGAYTLKIPTPNEAHSPLAVSLSASLYEVGGRTISRGIKRNYWPADKLLGIRPEFADNQANENKEASFEIIRVNPKGEKLAADNIVATLIHIKRNYYWEFTDNNGWTRKETLLSYPVTSKTLAIADKASARLSLPVAYGEYRLELDDAETKTKASYTFYAGWGGGRSDTASAKPDKVDLALDKAQYGAGDTAKLTITPPSAADVIVMVESDKLLWEQRLSLGKEGGVVEIPISKDWQRHDLYITATALRKADKDSKVAPARAIGLIHLPLDRSERKLKLSLEAVETMRPEQPITIKVKAEGLSNEKAFVTLSAVDQGVLNITRYKTPDPFAFFFAKRRYAAIHYDMYGRIIEQVDGVTAKQRFGGDAAMGSGNKGRSNNVMIVDLFKGALAFNEQGEADVTFDIPGFDGALRLMALGFSADKFGHAEQDLIIASPVVPALTAPRVLAPGDNSRVVLDLNNTTDIEQAVRYNITTNNTIDIDKASDVFVIPAKSRKTLILPLKAIEASGTAQLDLKLNYEHKGEAIEANRQVKFAIRPAWTPTRLSRHQLLKTKGVTFDVPKSLADGFYDETVNVDVSISNYPPLDLKNAFKGLMQYPYGCLEQTTSRAYPFLFLDNALLEKSGMKPVSNADRQKHVQKAIARISGMQLSNGAFSLWSSNGNEEYWLTPYVTHFLLDAQEQGFSVPQGLLNKALKNLKTRLLEGQRYIRSRYKFSDSPKHLSFAARAYAAYVLAKTRKAPLGTMRAMLDKEMKEAKSGLPLLHLGLALKTMGDNRRAKLALDASAKLKRNDKNYLGDYGSVLRDQAMMLQLRLAHGIESTDNLALTQRLSNTLHNKPYLSTQEQVFLFLAGQQLAKKANTDWNAQLRYGSDAPVSIQRQGGYTTTLDAATLQQGVKVVSDNKAPLYVSVALNGYRTTPPTQSNDDKITIKREYFDLKGQPIKGNNYKGGELYLVHLAVKAKQAVNDALVSDLLPAGLELENTRLLENNDWMDLKLPSHSKSIRDYSYEQYMKHEGFLDDRYIAALALVKNKQHHLFYLARAVSVGQFIAPPAYVEDMYRPEIKGVGKNRGVISISE